MMHMNRTRGRNERGGVVLGFMAIALLVFMGLAVVAIDFGHLGLSTNEVELIAQGVRRRGSPPPAPPSGPGRSMVAKLGNVRHRFSRVLRGWSLTGERSRAAGSHPDDGRSSPGIEAPPWSPSLTTLEPAEEGNP